MRRTRIGGQWIIAALLLTLGPVWTPGLLAQQGGGYDPTLFAGLEWRNIGPNRGGRSIAVAGSVARPNEYYFGATGGGLWKTTDGGLTWRPVTDGQIRSSSVGAVAVCEANPDVVYIGMGEVQLRGNVMEGDGVYKSTDGGRTWKHLGLEDTRAIARIRIHPNNCDIVYVAALGHLFGRNQERGVYKTTDGGQTWNKVLYVSDRAGAVDLSMDAGNPDVLYAGFWQVYRTEWGLYSGGEDSGLWKTTDGGRTWTPLKNNPGLPKGIWGKVGVSVSPVDPNRVYAIIEAEEGGVFRSDDGGRTWERTNDERKLRQRAFYYTRIYADPIEKDRVYVLNVGFWRSDDAGKTFETQIRVPHSDNHDLWIAPNDNQRMINANDGGANVSINGGQTWTEQDYPTAQMYHVITTKHIPYHVCGAQQDNSTACVPSKGNGDEWYAVGGGESGYIAPDPTNLDVFYAGNYGGTLTRFDRRTGQLRSVNVWPENPMGHSSAEIKERFQWTFPIVFSRTEPNVLYVSSQHLWRTTDGGQSWERISPDLTRHDPKTMGPSGGPITKDQTGVETYATIFSVAPSYHDPNIIWVGSDDGLVHITRDGGKTWENITPKDMPEFGRVSLIEASPHSPGTAYLAVKRYRLDDRKPYIWRTHDYGKTWTKIVNGIPEHDFVHAVREDPKRKGLLYAGTEHGVYVSFDDGDHWQSLSLNLPDVAVHDLVVEEKDLVIATHGRSFYVLDDISPLRQLTREVASSRAHLFRPADAMRSIDRGVTVYYYLAQPANEVTIEFLDAAGNSIISFTGKREATQVRAAPGQGGGAGGFGGGAMRVSTDAGLQRFVWDMRYPGFTEFPGMILWAARTRGPRAVPGNYSVRLTVDGVTQTQPFRIVKDPRLTDVSQADLEAQFELAMRIRDKTSEANEAVILIRDLKAQIDERIQAANNRDITRRGEELKAALSKVEEEIYQVRNRSNQDPLNYPIKLNNKLAALLGVVENGDGRPTRQSYAVFDELSQRLAVQLQELERVLARDLEAFNRRLRDRNLPPVERKPAEELRRIAAQE
ncbi:MAG: glycosyl hydrolase [Gemmatimonadota bacterium]